MKKRILQCFAPFFGVAGVLAALLALWQQVCLRRARAQAAEAHPMQRVTLQGLEIAYRSAGRGRPLLLVHSVMAGASSREWDAVFDALAEHNRVYAIDLAGFGDSEDPAAPWSAYQYAQLLHSFIEEVIGRAVCICGANGGADLALVLTRLHPADVRRVALVSPEGIGGGFASPEDVQRLALLQKPLIGTQYFLAGTSKRSIRAMLENAFFAKERVTAELVRQYALAARHGQHAQAVYAGIATRFYAADTQAAFDALTCPMLLIWGEENRDNPAVYFEAAEKSKTYGTFALFEQTGMLPHMENSAAFLEYMEAFLQQNTKDRGKE